MPLYFLCSLSHRTRRVRHTTSSNERVARKTSRWRAPKARHVKTSQSALQTRDWKRCHMSRHVTKCLSRLLFDSRAQDSCQASFIITLLILDTAVLVRCLSIAHDRPLIVAHHVGNGACSDGKSRQDKHVCKACIKNLMMPERILTGQISVLDYRCSNRDIMSFSMIPFPGYVRRAGATCVHGCRRTMHAPATFCEWLIHGRDFGLHGFRRPYRLKLGTN